MESISQPRPRLGELLQAASLISAAQIEVALYDSYYYEHLRLGEILALRGWIGQKTADFFADRWWELQSQSETYPLGYYLLVEIYSLVRTKTLPSLPLPIRIS
jgi:hypothetical protein